MTLYEKALAALPPRDIAHHQSDLYLRISPESRKLVAEFKQEYGPAAVSTFLDALDRDMWYDIAFQYTPYWQNVAEGKPNM